MNDIQLVLRVFIENPKLMRESTKVLAKRFKVSEGSVKRARGEWRALDILETLPEKDTIGSQITARKQSENGDAEIKALLINEPKNDQEIIDFLKIDTGKYNLSHYWSIWKNERWEVSAFIKKKPVDETRYLTFLDNYVSNYKPLEKKDILLNDNFGVNHSLVINLSDVHLDKKTVDDEQIQDRIPAILDTLDKVLFTAYRNAYLSEIVLVAGSDFFNSDNFQGTTTNGTPQDNLLTFEKSFEIGFEFYETLINKLKQFCIKLKIIYIGGNHDTCKSFYLVYGLSKYYHTEENIEFDMGHSSRKISIFGETFMGFHHGNCKIEDLPLTFAKMFPKEWGLCKYHTIHTADKHYYMDKEIKGVRMFQSPSVSSADRWHDNMNYVGNERTVVGCLYHVDEGRSLTIEKRY